MGLPEIEIAFKTRAETAVRRSQNGVVALILADNTASDEIKKSYTYNLESDIDTKHWSTESLDYLNKAFLGAPKSVIVERIGTGEGYDDALGRLRNKKWNWLAIPGITKGDAITAEFKFGNTSLALNEESGVAAKEITVKNSSGTDQTIKIDTSEGGAKITNTDSEDSATITGSVKFIVSLTPGAKVEWTKTEGSAADDQKGFTIDGIVYGKSYKYDGAPGEVTMTATDIGGIKSLTITSPVGYSNVEKLSKWIIAQREAKKSFKAVLPCSGVEYNANHEGIVDFATEDIKVGAKTYSSAEYCVRIAGLIAGLPLTESATYQVLSEVESIAESPTPDEDVDNGKLILINDGEKIKIGRGVNSLSILAGDKTEDYKKIKIVEAMDLMRDDIRITFQDNYIGIVNKYDNKMLFIAAVNQYFAQLVAEGVLYDEGENRADIDIETQRKWLSSKYDISDWSDDQVRKAKTGSLLFAKANVFIADAIEDLKFNIFME